MSQNASTSSEAITDVAERVAANTMARRGLDYVGEVRRLLDAALVVIERTGTASRAKVAEIVAEAGLSNDAFYRHFASKDALVVALIEDGAARLADLLGGQLAKEITFEAKLRRWVRGIMSQSSGATAATTLAVLWNGSQFDASTPGSHHTVARLAELLHEPLRDLGSRTPELDAALITHTVVGSMSAHLWARTEPTRREIEHIIEFCMAAVTGRSARH